MASSNPSEEEVRKLSVEIRYFEQTAEALQQRLSMMNAALTDLTYANATLDNIEKEKENAELLVPIGGSSYMNAKLVNPDKVIVGIGAGAKTLLKERMDELEKTRNSAQQQLGQVAQRIAQSRNKIESLLAGMREGKQ